MHPPRPPLPQPSGSPTPAPPSQACPGCGDALCRVLTCPAGRLFHALLPAVPVWAWVSLLRLRRGPAARLSFDAAARRSGRSHPRPSGSDNPGCPPPRRCARLAPPAAPRPRHARGSPWLPALRPPAHNPLQGPSQPQASRPPHCQRHPQTESPVRRGHTPSHPTPSPSLPLAPASANARRAPAAPLPRTPQLCALLVPRHSQLSPHPTFSTRGFEPAFHPIPPI